MPNSKSGSPNLDLIQMVQQARMLHDAEAIPSKIAAVYWIEARPDAKTPPPTSRAGAFHIHVAEQQVDALWEKIKGATRSGSLGYKSRVATSAAPDQTPALRRILVCTVDATDNKDVERVRAALHQLGISEPISYEITATE